MSRPFNWCFDSFKTYFQKDILLSTNIKLARFAAQQTNSFFKDCTRFLKANELQKSSITPGVNVIKLFSFITDDEA